MDKEEKEGKIQTHEDLIIYQKAFEAAMIIFELSKKFPVEEKYSLTDPTGEVARSWGKPQDRATSPNSPFLSFSLCQSSRSLEKKKI